VLPDVPLDWATAVRRILDGDLRRVLVLGGTDAGKSSFCRLLLQDAASTGRVVTLLDADLGQKLAGPPACVTLADDTAAALAALAFVGALDPLRGWRRLVEGTTRLAAEAARDALLVVNTSGLVAGAGRRLKAAKIAAVRPQLLVAIGADAAVAAILADHIAIPALRLSRSPLARRKGVGERRLLRSAAFDAYFASAPAWALDLESLWRDGEAGGEALPAAGQLVGLADMAGRDLALGLVLDVRPAAPTLLLRAPRPAAPVAGLRWGALRLGRDPADAAPAMQLVQPARADRASATPTPDDAA
jgi:polynucleotide 5'-hydroxyl-kinase GRC3/NOL9